MIVNKENKKTYSTIKYFNSDDNVDFRLHFSNILSKENFYYGLCILSLFAPLQLNDQGKKRIIVTDN